jgi:hypothetical protein
MKIEFGLFVDSDLTYEKFVDQVYMILEEKLEVEVEKAKYTDSMTFSCKGIVSLFLDPEMDVNYYLEDFGMTGKYHFYIPFYPTKYAEGVNLVIQLIAELLKVHDGDLLLNDDDFVIFKRTKEGLWANDKCKEEYGFDFPLQQVAASLLESKSLE